nr:kynurenine formamidase [Leptinotarsa decemlineata]
MSNDCSAFDIDLSPSYWSKRFPRERICLEHVNFITKCSEEVKNSVPNQLNIPYGQGEREVIDIYGTDLPQDAPVFIHFHGGFWQEKLIRHNLNSFIAKVLRENQIKSIFVGYELCPNVTLDDLSRNIEKALKKCLEYVKQTRGIHLSGHSAGAQIVANLFKEFIPNLPEEERKLFKTAYLLAGIYDLMPLLKTSYNAPLKLDEQSAKRASPLWQKLIAEGTDFYVVVAEHDSPQFVEQGNKMNEYLLSLNLKSHLVTIKDVDHFDLLEKLFDSDYELTKLIVKSCSE